MNLFRYERATDVASAVRLSGSSKRTMYLRGGTNLVDLDARKYRTAGCAGRYHAISRLDHFLGKSPVNNLVLFRFTDALLEPLPNNEGIGEHGE